MRGGEVTRREALFLGGVVELDAEVEVGVVDGAAANDGAGHDGGVGVDDVERDLNA